jgi:hypothetical protein
MPTTIQTKPRPSLDLAAILAAAPAEPEPRSLLELAAEVCFPFTARAVLPGPAPRPCCGTPVGADRTWVRVLEGGGVVGTHHPEACAQCETIWLSARGQARRWVLLGHR